MGDLISCKEFLKRIKPYDTSDSMDRALYNFAYNMIMECPSEGSEKHGKWNTRTFGKIYACDRCNNMADGNYPYCPWCCAKMEVGG